MGMSDKSEALNLTIPRKLKEYLDYLSDGQMTNYGTNPREIALFIVKRELDKMMKRDPYALYWIQGLPPYPPGVQH